MTWSSTMVVTSPPSTSSNTLFESLSKNSTKKAKHKPSKKDSMTTKSVTPNTVTSPKPSTQQNKALTLANRALLKPQPRIRTATSSASCSVAVGPRGEEVMAKWDIHIFNP